MASKDIHPILQKLKEDPTGQRIYEWFQDLETREKLIVQWSLFLSTMAFLLLFPFYFWSDVRNLQKEISAIHEVVQTIDQYRIEDTRISKKVAEVSNSFQLRAGTSIRNMVTAWIQEIGISEETLIGFQENPGSQSNDFITEINAGFTLEQMNARSLTDFLKKIENGQGVFVDSITVRQAPSLDGFLNVTFQLKAFAQTGN